MSNEDQLKNVYLNLCEVTTNRLRRIKRQGLVFGVWRGKTAYQDDVVKCYHMHPENDGNWLFENIKPLWIEKKNLRNLRSLANREVNLLDKNNLLRDTYNTILICGLFQKETEKAIFVLFANDKPCWIAKSQIHNKKVYDLDGKKDICFEIPTWVAEDKLGKEVTNKFSDAKDIISQRLSSLTTKFNMGGLNV